MSSVESSGEPMPGVVGPRPCGASSIDGNGSIIRREGSELHGQTTLRYAREVCSMSKSVCPVCIKVVASGKGATCRACGAEIVQVSETLLASIPDQPGALAKLLEKIAQKGVNIKALRAMPRENGAALVFFSVDRVEEVLTIPEVERIDDLPISSEEGP